MLSLQKPWPYPQVCRLQRLRLNRRRRSDRVVAGPVAAVGLVPPPRLVEPVCPSLLPILPGHRRRLLGFPPLRPLLLAT